MTVRRSALPVPGAFLLCSTTGFYTACSKESFCQWMIIALTATSQRLLTCFQLLLHLDLAGRKQQTITQPHAPHHNLVQQMWLMSRSYALLPPLSPVSLQTYSLPPPLVLPQVTGKTSCICNFTLIMMPATPCLWSAGSSAKSKFWTAAGANPNDTAPSMPPPSPTSPPVSTPDFGSVAHSTSSAADTSAVHW